MILGTLVALTGSALAVDVHWWGVGPLIGTMAVPGEYPFSFPAIAKTDAGEPMVEKARGDMSLGGRVVMYPSSDARIGLRGLLGFGLGSPWSSQQFTIEYDYPVLKEDGFQILLGGGVGAGTERFGGTEGQYEQGFLRTNYFPFRVDLAALLRDRTRAYELGLYGEYHVASNQIYFTGENDDGTSSSEGDALIEGALYAKIGVEATVFFGDFKTKSSGSNKADKKKNKKNK